MDRDDMQSAAMRLFQAGVAAADPFEAVNSALSAKPPAPGTRIVAVGKAAMRMAEAALLHVSNPAACFVVTNPENAGELSGAQVFAASHPIPDAIGLSAGKAVLKMLNEASNGDHVLALISGGGSALLPAPAEGLTLDDKIAVNRLLLASGAEITEINLIRQVLSRLKGGGMARAAAPAQLRALILSDVVGDDLSAIASGPTAPPLGTRLDARAMLNRYNLLDKTPSAVRVLLEAPSDPRAETTPSADNALIGSNTQSIFAMAQAAREIGLPVHMHSPPLTGDVEDAARRVAGTTDKGIHLFGGETTVQLTGDGKGGRNQELALRVALHFERKRGPWVYLQGGTDGRDGPTDAAGGLVNDQTMTALRAKANPEALLLNNDAYTALKAAQALLMTGGTGTNVADLGILIL